MKLYIYKYAISMVIYNMFNIQKENKDDHIKKQKYTMIIFFCTLLFALLLLLFIKTNNNNNNNISKDNKFKLNNIDQYDNIIKSIKQCIKSLNKNIDTIHSKYYYYYQNDISYKQIKKATLFYKQIIKNMIEFAYICKIIKRKKENYNKNLQDLLNNYSKFIVKYIKKTNQIDQDDFVTQISKEAFLYNNSNFQKNAMKLSSDLSKIIDNSHMVKINKLIEKNNSKMDNSIKITEDFFMLCS